MIETLRAILEQSLNRLGSTATTYIPPLLAALVIFLAAWAIAAVVRAAFLRLTKTAWLDRFVVESGLSSLFGRTRPLQTAPLVAGVLYWLILLVGLLTGLNAFNTALTTKMVEEVVFLLPKLAAAGVILLVGVWLSQYLARSTLVWAVNENLPHPRRLAMAVRVLVVFVAVVVAADHLNFARTLFLAAFLLVVGGIV
ncbi:MAG: mechanosensitive ion channel family protein, partial [Bryobacteraceae bacterium]